VPVSRFIAAALVLAAMATGVLALASYAWAQAPGAALDGEAPTPAAEVAGRGFETIGRALREFAGLPTGEVQAGAFRATRLIEEQFPAPPGTAFDLDTQFGHLTVTGWDEPVIALDVTISVEAPTTDAARAVADLTILDIRREEGRVSARARYPQESPAGTRITLTCAVKAPHGMALAISNAFGRTTVRGMRGSVVLDHRHGAVDLDRLDGPITLRATGARVTTAKLSGALSLFLADSETTLAPVAGLANIQVAGGALVAAPPAPGGRIDLVAQAARVTVHDWPLDQALEAAVLHGEITGAPPALTTETGPLKQLFTGSGEPTMRLGLAFGVLHFDATPALFALPEPAGRARAGSVETQLYEATEEDTLPLDNVEHLALVPGPATVRLVGEDRKNIRFERTRRVWAASPAHASTLFDAIGADATHAGGALTLSHRVAQTGGARYAVTWEVRYPASMPVRVTEGTGSVSLIGAAGGAVIDHAGGDLRVVRARGVLRIVQKAGGVTLEECQGAADIEAGNGPVHVNGHTGELRINTVHGNTAIENHHGKLEVAAQDGDVRVLTGSLNGDIDIRCENGHGALLLPRDASANLDIRLEGGQIYSAIPLTGSVDQGRQAFHALLGTGDHRVRLECTGGNLRIDQPGPESTPGE
jgi:hypothetical protein